MYFHIFFGSSFNSRFSLLLYPNPDPLQKPTHPISPQFRHLTKQSPCKAGLYSAPFSSCHLFPGHCSTFHPCCGSSRFDSHKPKLLPSPAARLCLTSGAALVPLTLRSHHCYTHLKVAYPDFPPPAPCCSCTAASCVSRLSSPLPKPASSSGLPAPSKEERKQHLAFPGAELSHH